MRERETWKVEQKRRERNKNTIFFMLIERDASSLGLRRRGYDRRENE
jgi:hypothetical protein